MKLTPVKSSSIKAMGYDHENGCARIQFHSGQTYEYEMPAHKFEALKDAPSLGKHFMKHVRPHHEGRPI